MSAPKSDLPAPTARLPLRPMILAVTGASGSGKTTLAAELARTVGGLPFSLDSYYRDLGHLQIEQRVLQNFDDPALIEAPLLFSDLAAMARGEAIERPLYNFAEYTRVPGETETIHPGAVVVVEGLFVLYFPELRPFYHFSIYVDTPDDVCFARRLRRDVEQRGREPDTVRYQYDATVRPCGLAFVRPQIDFADLVIDGTDSLDFKIEAVLSALRRRGLLVKAVSEKVPL
jgi:uridine kinase